MLPGRLALHFAIPFSFSLLLAAAPHRTAVAQTAAGDPQPIATPALNPRMVEAQTAEVQLIFRLTNEDRASQALPLLQWSPQLAAAALAHARRMAAAATGELSHRYPGEPELAARASASGAHFSSIAENIAQGGSARAIEKQWMNSVPHRTNILDGRMNAIGVAVSAAGGTLYAVEDFAATQAMLTPEQIEAQVAGAIHAVTPGGSPLAVIEAAQARSYCAASASSGPMPNTKARFELVWEGPDLQLPAPLAEAVQSGLYHVVSIGACSPQGASNRSFTVYRTAVLLY